MGKELYWLCGVLGTIFVFVYVANRGITPALPKMKQDSGGLIINNGVKLSV